MAMSIDTIIIEWHIDDVRGESKHPLTDDQCREVLSRVKHYHDCNVGVNWDVINHYANAVAEGR
jgi:hypothetical protein